MRTSYEGVSSDHEPSTLVQSSVTTGLPNGKGNIEPSICGIVWSGTSDQSMGVSGSICYGEPCTSELSYNVVLLINELMKLYGMGLSRTVICLLMHCCHYIEFS